MAFLALIGIFILAAVPALAGQTQVDVYEGQKLVRSVVFVVGRAEYFVNGETPGVKMDVAPYIDQGRTFVPVRYLGYALGVEEKGVKWDGKKRQASLALPPNTVEMVIGKKQIVANGQAREIDVAPQLKPPGRTFLPARYVAEGLGYQVDYENAGGTEYVVCWPKGQPRPGEDIAKVKQHVAGSPPAPGPKPENPGFPETAKRVYSAGQFMVEPPHVDLVKFDKAEVYEAFVSARDLPAPCDELGCVYKIEIDRAKFTQYEEPAIKIIADNDEPVDLIIVSKGGKDIRYRQVHDSMLNSSNKWVLLFCPNEFKDKYWVEDTSLPLLKPEDVDYFGLSTVGLYPYDVCGVLWIKNPYKNGS